MPQIIEIALEIKSSKDYDFLENLLTRLEIPYYVKPGGRFKTLKEIEIQCEGD